MSTIPHKTCFKCGVPKPIDDFSREKKSRDGKHRLCRACRKIDKAKSYQRNKDKIIADTRAYTLAHPEQRRQASRDHYHRYGDAYRAADRARTEEERIRERKRLRDWKRKQVATSPEWRAKDREIQRARYHRNPITSLAKSHQRRARISENGGAFTSEEWDILCARYDHRCLCCGAQKRLTIDHVVPISKGGGNDISNIQPLCLSCNARKSSAIVDYRT